MMACPVAVSDQADAYMAALTAADSFEVRANQINLLDGKKVVVSFVSGLQDLAGTDWQVIAYNNGKEAVVSVMSDTELTAAFDEESRISGNAGCNDYFATYLTSEGNILFGSIGSTRRICATPNGVMEQEHAYLAALQSATTYTLEGNTLEMRNSSDAIAVQMTRALVVKVPEPEAGVPTGRVTCTSGVNVRSGPGTNFPSLGVAPFGTEGEIIGRSADGRWWVAAVPTAPGGMGWVSADCVAVTDAADVPVIASPAPPVVIIPTATPFPTPTPQPAATATPAPQMSFTADQTTINQGSCTTLRWSVENVQAVWVYPVGQNFQSFPQVGQGTMQVCPATTTTYEMRVQQRDGTVVTQQITITVNPAPSATNPLNGTAWQATSFNNGQGALVSPIVGTTLTARFDASNITGQSGCNDFSGGYSVSGSNISIGQLISGMMACEQNVMEQEQQYLAALQSASTYQFDGNRLILRRWDGAMAAQFSRLQ